MGNSDACFSTDMGVMFQSFRINVQRTIRLLMSIFLVSIAGNVSAEVISSDKTEISIMTFNVENLFDNIDDPGKTDETFLALKDKQSATHKQECGKISVERWRNQCLFWDWNDAVLDKKLRVIAASIRQVGEGRGADIIALQEVENIGILERLRENYLRGLGYQPAVLVEGRDRRGIDVAFLSRLPVSGVALHDIPFSNTEESRVLDTRGILEATFELPDGEKLVGFAVHFPAPFHPTFMREMAYQKLSRLKAALDAGQPAFAAGDFNTTSEEDKNKKMLSRLVKPDWQVVHENCDGCKGTSYYPPKDDWSFLDMILWSNGVSAWRMNTGSVLIANTTGAQVTKQDTPARFELPEGTGVSDHWPLVFTITLPDQAGI